MGVFGFFGRGKRLGGGMLQWACVCMCGGGVVYNLIMVGRYRQGIGRRGMDGYLLVDIQNRMCYPTSLLYFTTPPPLPPPQKHTHTQKHTPSSR